MSKIIQTEPNMCVEKTEKRLLVKLNKFFPYAIAFAILGIIFCKDIKCQMIYFDKKVYPISGNKSYWIWLKKGLEKIDSTKISDSVYYGENDTIQYSLLDSVVYYLHQYEDNSNLRFDTIMNIGWCTIANGKIESRSEISIAMTSILQKMDFYLKKDTLNVYKDDLLVDIILLGGKTSTANLRNKILTIGYD